MALQQIKKTIRSIRDAFVQFIKNFGWIVAKISGVQRKGFVDYNNIGMNTRTSILFREAESCVLTKSKGKISITGSWKCRYSNKVIKDASDLDIDHIVPLQYAKNNKIGIWTATSFQEFENDTDNLVAVDKSLNRQKRDKSLVEWKPPKNQSWYHSKWKEICSKWTIEEPRK